MLPRRVTDAIGQKGPVLDQPFVMADHTSCSRDKLSQNYAADGGNLFSVHNLLLAVIQSNISRPKANVACQPA